MNSHENSKVAKQPIRMNCLYRYWPVNDCRSIHHTVQHSTTMHGITTIHYAQNKEQKDVKVYLYFVVCIVVCVCMCVRACVRAFVRACTCVRACVCVADIRAGILFSFLITKGIISLRLPVNKLQI